MVRRRLLALLVAVTFVLAGCSSSFGAPDPASKQADATFSLWRGTIIAAGVVGLIVWGLITWSLLRYRRRSDDIPNQRSFNLPLEITYTVIPILIVAGLFFFTLRTQHDVNKLSAHPDVTVDVLGFQWQWQFRYEGATPGTAGPLITGDSAGAPPEMVLPVGRTIRLKLVAQDVNHSFWVPRFLYKRDLIPGVRNQIDVTPTRPGTYVGRCAEFCGLDHWRMNFSVRVVSEAEYQTWLAEQEAGGS